MEVVKVYGCSRCESKFCDECGDIKNKLCYDCIGWEEDIDDQLEEFDDMEDSWSGVGLH